MGPQTVSTEPTEREKTRKARHAGSFLFGVGVMAVVLIQLYTILAIRNTQQEGSPTTKRLIAIAEQIDSCTNPEGDCYKRGQEQTAKAIVGINKGTLLVIVAALSCSADGITDQEQLARCTIERSKP